MSVTYHIDPEEKVVALAYVGESDYAEWERAMLAVFSDPSFESGFSFLSDRRKSPPPTPAFVRQAVGFIRSHEASFGRCRWAVAVADPASYGMARMKMSGTGLDEVTTEFFYNYEEAPRWLLGR